MTPPGRMGKGRRLIIAMDGPAGVGKSTVGQLVAKDLGYYFVNTGEMYRALTWKAMEEGVDLKDESAVMALAKRLSWEFKPSENGTALKTFLDGESVSSHIRAEEVSRSTSLVAAMPSIRRFLCGLQRGLGKAGGVVMEGRDIATHVFPNADVKIYLDASLEERAKRRIRQLRSSGHSAESAGVRNAILQRDRNDLERKINPLAYAAGATLIDSTRLSMHGVARKILKIVKERQKQ